MFFTNKKNSFEVYWEYQLKNVLCRCRKMVQRSRIQSSKILQWKKHRLVHLTYKNNTSADLSKVFTMLKWLEEKILISKTYKNQIVQINFCNLRLWNNIFGWTQNFLSLTIYGIFFLLNSTTHKKYCFIVSKRPHI